MLAAWDSLNSARIPACQQQIAAGLFSVGVAESEQSRRGPSDGGQGHDPRTLQTEMAVPSATMSGKVKLTGSFSFSGLSVFHLFSRVKSWSCISCNSCLALLLGGFALKFRP